MQYDLCAPQYDPAASQYDLSPPQYDLSTARYDLDDARSERGRSCAQYTSPELVIHLARDLTPPAPSPWMERGSQSLEIKGILHPLSIDGEGAGG